MTLIYLASIALGMLVIISFYYSHCVSKRESYRTKLLVAVTCNESYLYNDLPLTDIVSGSVAKIRLIRMKTLSKKPYTKVKILRRRKRVLNRLRIIKSIIETRLKSCSTKILKLKRLFVVTFKPRLCGGNEYDDGAKGI